MQTASSLCSQLIEANAPLLLYFRAKPDVGDVFCYSIPAEFHVIVCRSPLAERGVLFVWVVVGIVWDMTRWYSEGYQDPGRGSVPAPHFCMTIVTWI